MDTFEKLTSVLSNRGITFETVDHVPVFTSKEAAIARGSDVRCGPKCLIFFADRKPIMIVVPGDKRLDIKKFKAKFSVEDLRFATPEEVEEITGGVKIGAVHPIGSLYGLSVYLDRGLQRCGKLVFTAGLHDKSIKMYYKDYVDLVTPAIGNFAV